MAKYITVHEIVTADAKGVQKVYAPDSEIELTKEQLKELPLGSVRDIPAGTEKSTKDLV